LPAAALFVAGIVCGPVEACLTLWLRSCRYASSMSLTTMAICWNQRSLLRESTGMGRPCGARYSVRSINSSPNFMRTTRIRAPKTPCSRSYSLPAASTSETFSNDKILEKNSTDWSMSETVMPTASTDLTIDWPARVDETHKRNVGKNQIRTRTLTFSLTGRGKNFPSPPRGEGEEPLLNAIRVATFILWLSAEEFTGDCFLLVVLGSLPLSASLSLRHSLL